jgi:LPXTG-motif cell wall-anchored protein
MSTVPFVWSGPAYPASIAWQGGGCSYGGDSTGNFDVNSDSAINTISGLIFPGPPLAGMITSIWAGNWSDLNSNHNTQVTELEWGSYDCGSYGSHDCGNCTCWNMDMWNYNQRPYMLIGMIVYVVGDCKALGIFGYYANLFDYRDQIGQLFGSATSYEEHISLGPNSYFTQMTGGYTNHGGDGFHQIAAAQGRPVKWSAPNPIPVPPFFQYLIDHPNCSQWRNQSGTVYRITRNASPANTYYTDNCDEKGVAYLFDMYTVDGASFNGSFYCCQYWWQEFSQPPHCRFTPSPYIVYDVGAFDGKTVTISNNTTLTLLDTPLPSPTNIMPSGAYFLALPSGCLNLKGEISPDACYNGTQPIKWYFDATQKTLRTGTSSCLANRAQTCTASPPLPTLVVDCTSEPPQNTHRFILTKDNNIYDTVFGQCYQLASSSSSSSSSIAQTFQTSKGWIIALGILLLLIFGGLYLFRRKENNAG